MGQILRIRGGQPLEGAVRLPAAKNSVLPILAACVLCRGPVTLCGVPRLADVQASLEILQALGLQASWQGADLKLQPAALVASRLPEGPARAMRSSVFYLAPVLHRAGRVRMPLPGGCKLGPRPIDIHLDGLARMGAQVGWQEGWLTLTAPRRLQGVDYTLRLPSVGATETLLMAACLAQGDTVLRGVAREPEIGDLAAFLRACGAQIEGEGTGCIRVRGVRQLGGACHTPIPDRIVAATVAAAVAGCGGSVRMDGCPRAALGPVAQVLEQAGCEVKAPLPGSLLVQRQGRLRGVGLVRTGVYPGFSTDAAPVAAAGLLAAEGESIFEDTIFEDRFACAAGFEAMGAQVRRQGRALRIAGPARLRGAEVSAQDLRGGAGLVVAALAASGPSTVREAGYVRRGYEDIAALFAGLGGHIKAGEEP